MIYTIHIDAKTINELLNHPKVVTSLDVVADVSLLKTDEISYDKLGELIEFAEASGDSTLINIMLDIATNLATAGRWTSWSELRQSGHNPSFDTNFTYQAFMKKYWR